MPGTKGIICYARGVVTRLAAVFYGLPVTFVEEMFDAHALSWGSTESHAVQLIRGFLVHAFQKAPKGTTTIVILADEVVKAETFFALAGDSILKHDFTTVLRKAVLNERIAPGLDAALVISSLTINPIGQTTSSRAVKPLVLRELDHDTVVKDWWGRCKHEDLVAFGPLAATVSCLPRLAEFAAIYLKDHNKPPTPKFMVRLLNELKNRIEERYRPDMLSKEELRAVVFREEILLDNNAMERIEDSLFTNSLVNFKQNHRLRIVPEASLLLLAAGAQTRADHSDLLKEFLRKLKLRHDGDMLEWCTHWWLRVRLAVILGKQGFSLANFLGLDTSKIQGLGVQLDRIYAIHFDVPGPRRLVAIITHKELNYNKLANSHADQQGFLSDLGRIMLTPGKVRLFQSPKSERFDYLLAVCGRDGPFLVFIENKSRMVQKKMRSDGRKAKRLDSAQANYVEELAQAASKQVYPAGSLARALGQNQYGFLYITSHDGESEELDNCIVLRGVDSENFFGPLWSFYRAVRASVRY